MFPFIRSLLFLPAHRLDWFGSAKASGASIICVDLQDGLPRDQINSSRHALQQLLQRDPGCTVAVRINQFGSEYAAEDVTALECCPTHPNAIVIPVVKQASEVRAAAAELATRIPKASLIVMIETASAICDLDSICAACPADTALLFGNVDYSTELHCANDWEALGSVRSRLVMFAGKWSLPVFDGVTIDLENETLLEEDCRKAKRFGFFGKSAVHPKQVKIINRIFAVTAEQAAEAMSIVAAYEAGSGGAIRVGNKMVDRPVYLAALNVLKARNNPTTQH